ncbi:hypothetical protein [Sphingomonas sp. 28-62-11]|uniref:hypothetical protein n=1 Tax=Sphingomonas sp. 28-62-11 TaxID=1970432 RepID=UPI000BD919D9|nr:MAG: hypothetical protein B7Y49_12580 [Sphingomonas sp. 28-62-11]
MAYPVVARPERSREGAFDLQMQANRASLPWHIRKLRRIRRSAWLAILLLMPIHIALSANGPASALATSLPIHSENYQ